ncbi:MAG: hypothetical protein AAFQ94_16890 [Bacteroidota bacterium]
MKTSPDLWVIRLFLIGMVLFGSKFTLNAQSDIISDENEPITTLSFNELKRDEIVILPSERINISVQAKNSDQIICEIYNDDHLVTDFSFSIEYGMNEHQIDLFSIIGDKAYDKKYYFKYKSKFFGSGKFTFYVNSPAVTKDPSVSISYEEVVINCGSAEKSTINYLGNVMGGAPPYKLSWFISKDEYLASMLEQPVNSTLKSDKEVSYLTISKPLDYFLTLVVTDACGKVEKEVVEIKCQKEGQDDLIYFQPIITKTNNSQ